MKRPLADIGFSMLSALVLSVIIGHTAAKYFAVVCFVSFTVLLISHFFFKRKTVSAAVCCISASLAILFYCMTVTLYIEPILNQYNSAYAEIEAVVTSTPKVKDGCYYFTIRTSQINGEEKKLNIQIIAKHIPLPEYCDKVKIKTTLLSNYTEELGYGSYSAARGLFLKAFINPFYQSTFEITDKQNKPFYSVFAQMRNTASDIFSFYLPDDSAEVCTAMITGDRNSLSDDLYSMFKNMGTSHLLVVSGLHLSIIAEIIYKTAGKRIKNRYISALIQLAGITLFAVFAGFGFSVIRALIMTYMVIIGRTLSLRSDALNSLGLAAAILCLNPLNAGDIGLLWSFSSTLSIILLSDRTESYLIRRLDIKSNPGKKTARMISVPTAAFIGSAPFYVFIVGTFSPYSIIVNLLTVPFAGVIIICGGIGAVLYALGIPPIAAPFMFICKLTSGYIIKITEIFSTLPYAYLKIGKISVYICFLISVLLITATVIFDKKRKYIRLSIAAVISLLILTFSIDFLIEENRVTLSVLDVGNGLTITLKQGNKIILINSYGEKYQYTTIKSELAEFREINCMVDLCPEGQYNYCQKIYGQFDVNRILLYDNNKLNYDYASAQENGTTVTEIADDFTYYTYDGVSLRFISDENLIWCSVNIYGKNILICPEGADIENLPEELSSPDMVISCEVPEHSAMLSDSYWVLSCFGEAADEGYSAVTGNGSPAAVTDGKGRIDFTFAKDGGIKSERHYTGGVAQWQK